MAHDYRSAQPPATAGEVDVSAGMGPGKTSRVTELEATIQRRAQGAPRPGGAGPTTGTGEPLPDATRAKMEGAFGTSFGDVRVHQGEHAGRAGAEAYAEGSNLHFAPGRYAPASPAGDELIGHELTHVVQQRAGRVAAPAQHKGGINDDPSLEAEADAMGARAAAGERVAVPGATASGGGATAIQRKITLGGGAGKPPSVIELRQVDQLVSDVIALGDPALLAAANKANPKNPHGAIREAVLVLYRNDRAFDNVPAVAAAAVERLALIHDVATVDWSGDANSIAGAHPEREAFTQALHGRVAPERIEALWQLTIAGVKYQKDLNDKGTKHEANPHYVQLAKEFEALLSIEADDKPALWSGGYDVSMYAQDKGYRTLEVTHAGKMFDQLKLFKDFSALGPLWNNISKKFVSSFAGETHVFVRTMDKGSVLFRQELGEAIKLDGVQAMKWHVIKGSDLATLTEVDGTGKPTPGHAFDGYRAAAGAMEVGAFRAPEGKDKIANEPTTPQAVRDKMVGEQSDVPTLVANLNAFVDERARELKIEGDKKVKVEQRRQRAERRIKNDPALGRDLHELYEEIRDDLAKDIAHIAGE